MMACDVCGKTGTALADLREQYQFSDIKQVCPACEETMNRHLDKLVVVTTRIKNDWFKAWLAQMKARFAK